MAQDTRIKCGLIESTFANLREVVSAYMKQQFWIGPMFLSNIALNRASIIANFNPDEVVPEYIASKINNPVFIAHGDKDKKIDFHNSIRIYNNLANKNNQLYIIKNADHSNLSKMGGINYKEKVIQFFNSNLQ